MRELAEPLDDGFSYSTVVRYPDKVKGVFKVLDDVLPDATRLDICREAGAKPWGLYLPFFGEEALKTKRERLALEAFRAVFRGVDLEGCHGVAVWCLKSEVGARVEYHVDYSELHRKETNEIVPPVYGGVYHASDISMRGGDFYVNTLGLEHYARHGYKAAVDAEKDDRGWLEVRYRKNRGIVFDGEYPHFASKILSATASRIILGFNVFTDRVKDVNLRAPEHSQTFNTTVKLYQAAKDISIDAAKSDKKLARFLVALARSHLDVSPAAAAAATKQASFAFSKGDRVLARWRTGLRSWPATVAAVREEEEEEKFKDPARATTTKRVLVDLVYDDGFQWRDAPSSVVVAAEFEAKLESTKKNN